jgi:polyribonucleotide nucleotidyltransferase
MTFGAFVELLPGKEGLLHISEVSDHRIPKIESALNVGDKVLVTVKEIDDMKRVNLSRKRLLSMLDELSQDPKFEEQIEIEKQREEEYANLPKNEDGVRHENMGRSRKDFPSSDKNREARPARRFDRDKRR